MSPNPSSWSASLLLGALLVSPVVLPAQRDAYVPPRRGEWAKVSPEHAGFDPDRLAAAVRFAQQHFAAQGGYDPTAEPYGERVGPWRAPTGMNGLVLVGGRIAAEWGDTAAVDMTFSITKTYLSTVAGLLVDDGLLDPAEPARRLVQDGTFDVVHNRPITWHQLLNQTSGWEGTLWGKPDWADRYTGERRAAESPGERWRYNDVRVNVLALALLQVAREPLPQLLKRRVMDPIGCSTTWRWHGYDNSWVTIDGLSMQSVSGGGHWGGGMWISSRDHARFGLLMLRDGRWGEQQLISPQWLERARTPTPQKRTYGYMNWFLNTDAEKHYPSAPVGDVFFLGAGTNLIWLCPSKDMVVVVRWLDGAKVDAFLGAVLAAFV